MDPTTVIVVIAGAAFGLLIQRLFALGARLDRLSRLEGKIDALLRASGIDYDPFETVPGPVRQALEQGKYVLAIKRLREATGLGLVEAKATVDELRRRQRGATGSRV